jgi:Zn-dependent protease with chaperone function
VVLVLSGPYVDRVDDRQLRGVLAHEVVHIVRDDLKRVRARIWVSLIIAATGGIALGVLAGGGLALPVYGAAGLVAVMVANVGLSTFNRRLERRADLEGALLCNDTAALAGALGVAQAFSDEARRRIYGPRPWRWILSPLSWRMPTHPPMSDRIRRLSDLVPIESPVGIRDPSDPLPGVT